MTLGVFSVNDRVDDAVLIASVQGAFFGTNLRAAQIEGLIAAHVPRKHIAEIADTYDTKWWDYRRLSPGHSFLLFAHHYYQASKIAARKFLAERRRKQASTATMRGAALVGIGIFDWKVEEIWDRDAAHITGMWNAMKMADALGIPYDQYCRLGNQVAIDTLWTRVPKPAQLYGTKLGAQVLDRWEKLSESRLFVAHHPLYSEANFAGLPVQEAYRAWLIEAIEKRGDPTTALASVVFRTPQLPEAVARQHFPAMSVDRARLIAA